MTKDEIKKALDCCAKSYGDDVHCTDCPYDTLTPRACCERFCQDVLCKDALKLITEQEKEIERLKEETSNIRKETAKEILDMLYDMGIDKETLKCCRIFDVNGVSLAKQICEKYGVEIEK